MLQDFFTKLRAEAVSQFSWVITNPGAKPLPAREPMPIMSDQAFWEQAASMDPQEERAASR